MSFDVFCIGYLSIGLVLLWPLWWQGDFANPFFVLLFWPIVAVMTALDWIDQKRLDHQAERRHREYRRRYHRRGL